MLSPAAIAALRADYTDADPTRENPDPRLVAVLDSYEHLLTLAETVRALLPDLRAAEDGSCTVCGAEEHEDDCPVPAVVAALARVSGRRVPGRPAGQRIAEEPTAMYPHGLPPEAPNVR